MSRRDPHPLDAHPGRGPEVRGRVILPIAYRGLAGEPVDLIALGPVEATDLAESLLSAARLARKAETEAPR